MEARAGEHLTITCDLSKSCAECGKGGAVDNGLCMECTSKAMGKGPLKSDVAKAVRKRLHNLRGEAPKVAKSGFAKDHLKSFIDRVERLEEERNALTADIREVYSEAKGTGFDTKIMREVVRLRKLDKADFQEREAVLDLYLTALDMR